MGKKNDNTLVKNASFLMVAALISKIIGMLYKSPLSTTLGSQSFASFPVCPECIFYSADDRVLQYSAGSIQDHGGKDRFYTDIKMHRRYFTVH